MARDRSQGRPDGSDPAGITTAEAKLGLSGAGRALASEEIAGVAHWVGAEKPQKLKDLFPDLNYGDDEVGRKDRFDAAFPDGPDPWYVGKDYPKGGTEILSMGLQKLIEDPVGFAKVDPEFCKYVLGCLDGSLR